LRCTISLRQELLPASFGRKRIPGSRRLNPRKR
jgi:hypothetical protein